MSLKNLKLRRNSKFSKYKEMHFKQHKNLFLSNNEKQEILKFLKTFLEILTRVRMNIMTLTSCHQKRSLVTKQRKSFGKCSSLKELSKILRKLKKFLIRGWHIWNNAKIYHYCQKRAWLLKVKKLKSLIMKTFEC